MHLLTVFRGDFQNAIPKNPVEKQGGDILWMGVVQVVEHPAQIPFSLQFLRAGREFFAQAEVGREIPGSRSRVDGRTVLALSGV